MKNLKEIVNSWDIFNADLCNNTALGRKLRRTITIEQLINEPYDNKIKK